jgi:hypothetical protein
MVGRQNFFGAMAREMTREEFMALFEQSLEEAARNAETKLGRAVPRSFEIVLRPNPPYPGMMTVDEACDKVYLGRDRFYLIIDLAVVRVSLDAVVVYMRPSGHEPGPFDQTWNQPPGTGPFKQLLSNDISEI